MNIYSKKLIGLILILLSTNVLLAQTRYCDFIYHDNSDEVTADIMQCYFHRVNIEVGELKTFVMGNRSAQSNLHLSAPRPDVSRQGSHIFFEWQNAEVYTFYEIRIINLNTGATITDQTEANRYRFFMENGDLYAFVFSTYLKVGQQKEAKSIDFIIIDEKPIFVEGLAIAEDYPCTCHYNVLSPNNNDISIGSRRIGVEIPLELSELSVYPNPGADEFNLTYTLASAQNVSIQVVDALGKVQRELQAPQQRLAGTHYFSFQLNDLPNGWYQCVLQTGKERKSTAILKTY